MAFYLRTHFVMMASYHRWASRRIFTGIRQLEDPTKLTRPVVSFKPPMSVNAPLSHKTLIDNPHPLVANLGLPMGSIYETLAHLYYADQVWLCRLGQKEVPESISSLWGNDENILTFAQKFNQDHGIPPFQPLEKSIENIITSTSTSSIPTFLPSPTDSQTSAAIRSTNLLTMELDDQNNDLLTIVKGYTEQDLSQKIKYKTTDDVEYNRARVTMLTHYFNHATHHRGQITSALTQLGVECPGLDLTAYMPEWEELHDIPFDDEVLYAGMDASDMDLFLAARFPTYEQMQAKNQAKAKEEQWDKQAIDGILSYLRKQ